MKETKKKYRNLLTRRKLHGGQQMKGTAKHPTMKIKQNHTAKNRCFTDQQLSLHCLFPK